MLSLVQKAKEALLNTLFPAFCAGCKKEGKYLCDRCQIFISEAAFICPVCEKPSFLGETHMQCRSKYGLDGLISFWEYEGVIKDLLHAIKYQGVRDAVPELAENGRKIMETDLYRFRAFLEFLANEHTIISFVPMHITREKRRGFNQAQDIAFQLAALLQGKQVVKTLEKTKDTPSQADLTREERLQNLRGSFGCLASPSSQNIQAVLVDDVWTTGATMRECCRVLKKAAGTDEGSTAGPEPGRRTGVQKVWGCTLARTV